MAGPWEKYADQPGLTAESADEEFKRKVEELKAQYGKNTEAVSVLSPTGKDTTTIQALGQEFDVPTFFTTPAGAGLTAAGAALAAVGAYQVGKKGIEASKSAYNAIKDRMLNKPVEIDRTTDIPLDTRPIPTTEGPPPPLKEAPMVASGLQNTFQNELNKQVEGLQKAGAVPGSAAPNVAPQPVAPAAPATPTVTQAVEAGVSPTQALQVDVAKQLDATPPVQSQFVTGTGREVIPGQGKETKKFKTEYKSPTDVPKGYFFLPEGQYIDVLRNDLGQQTYTQQFKNKPFPTDYEKAVAEAKSINRELNRPTRAEMKASGVEPPEVTPGINKSVSGKKAVRVGGVLGSLVAMSDIANAGQRGGMKEAAQTLGEVLLPMGVTPSQLASGTLTPEIIAAQNRFMQERQKLGSPYRSVPPPR